MSTFLSVVYIVTVARFVVVLCEVIGWLKEKKGKKGIKGAFLQDA